jgi:exonuclease VII large subunit
MLNPLTILARGFSIVENESGEVLRDSAQATPGTGLKITLAHGWLKAEVTKNEAGEPP